MQTFANWEDVPLFDQEDAEANFWAENRPDLRFDPRMLARIKRVARTR